MPVRLQASIASAAFIRNGRYTSKAGIVRTSLGSSWWAALRRDDFFTMRG
jgi:hypothetical protein